MSFGFGAETRAIRRGRRCLDDCEEYGWPSSALQIATGDQARFSALPKGGAGRMESKHRNVPLAGIERKSPVALLRRTGENKRADDSLIADCGFPMRDQDIRGFDNTEDSARGLIKGFRGMPVLDPKRSELDSRGADVRICPRNILEER